LLEYETLTGDEITNALKGIAPVREDAEDNRPLGPSVSVPLTPIAPPLADPGPLPA
jgi:cell division protease FtsH